MRAQITRIFSSVLTSRLRRRLMRVVRRRGAPVIDYFHQADDPYSHLVLQVLTPLAARYGVKVRPWLVPPPNDAAAPEREKLQRFALRDAVLVASEYGLSFPTGADLPAPEAVAAANARLAAVLASPDFALEALAVGEALWTGKPKSNGPTINPESAMAAGEAERLRRRHYLGGMLYFEGEWYWGVDRLNHLEERLAGLGLDTAAAGTSMLAPYRDMALGPVTPGADRPVIEIWFSFRSPYSWIAFPRVRRLAAHYGAELRLRYILPMVMRGLPVPRAKTLYIMLDTKREAERVGLPFGTMVDPVGPAIERTIAVLHHAVAAGRGEAFAERALKAIFAEGSDLTKDTALYRVAADAGLARTEVEAALASEDWRVAAEANRQALFEAGLWGAPTYRVNGGVAHWGQDRLWALEHDLQRAMDPPTP